jgi:hypothetical protein
MNKCPDCATPDLCRTANYDCGHEREATTVGYETVSDGTVRTVHDDPARYAVERFWRNTCDDIRRTEMDIERSRSELAASKAHLSTLYATKRTLEDHAEHNDWTPLAPATEWKAS